MPTRLRSLYERFEFKSWLRDLTGRRSARRRGRGDRRSRVAPGHADVRRAGGARCVGGAAIRRRPFRATTRPCCDAATFERWVQAIERAPLVCFDTETTGLDPMEAKIVGLSFADRAGARVLHPARAPLSRRAGPAAARRDARAARALVRRPGAGGRSARTSSTTSTCSRTTASSLAGVAHDTLLQSYVLEAHRPHDMDNLAWRHLNVKTITYAEVAGKGAKQIGFDQVEHRRRDRLLGRGRRHHAAAAPVPVSARRRRPQARPRLHGDRDAGARGPVRDGARRRDARHGAARGAEPRARREGDGAGAAGVSARRAAVQPRVAEAAGRDPVRQDEAADAAQDGDRASRRRTRTC